MYKLLISLEKEKKTTEDLILACVVATEYIRKARENKEQS